MTLTKIPIETYGKCKKCDRVALLGNGLCVECWDGPPSLTPEEIINRNWDIRNMARNGMKLYEIARRFGLDHTTVRGILRERR